MDVDDLWTRALGEIELEVTKASYLTFFKKTRISYAKSDGLVTVYCPNTSSAHMLQTRYASLVKHVIESRTGNPVTVLFHVVSIPTDKPAQESPGPLFESRASFEQTIRAKGLNPLYSFDNFAVSETNQMAFAAAQAVADRLGSAYNPLFLWGSVGVGKTHLAQALGQRGIVKNPSLNIIYCTGEEFTNEIIDAIRGKSALSFKRKYRVAHLLIVDDIQFIAGKESVQMEFFHTFNSVVQVGGQVVLTSDQPPSDIQKLERRLRSRFEGGLTIDIGRPNFELRTAILLIKAKERGLDLSIDHAKQLAAHFEDIRALEGALLRFYSESERDPDPLAIISRIVRKPLTEEDAGKKNTNPLKIIDIISSHFHIPAAHLVGKSRKKHIVEARHVLMYILRQELGLTTNKIGELIGGRDHTTIMHGVEKVTSILPKQDRTRQHLTEIRRLLWG